MKPHIVKFFHFLEDKEGKNAPLKIKLLNPNKFKFTKDDLNVKDDLDLSETSITSLPNGLRVSGYLDLSSCTSLESLPNGLHVDWSLNLFGCTSLKSLPDGLYVGNDLYLNSCTSLTSLPNNLKVVDGDLYMTNCISLKSLPDGLKVGRSLYLRKTPLAKMYSEDDIRAMIEATGGYVSRNILI